MEVCLVRRRALCGGVPCVEACLVRKRDEACLVRRRGEVCLVWRRALCGGVGKYAL